MKKSSPLTPEQWQAHLAAWQASDTTQAAYCKEHGLLPHTFQYWKTKLTRLPASSSASPAAPSLIPVMVVDDPMPDKASAHPAVAVQLVMSIHIDHRYRIDLMPGFDPAALRHVLSLLRE